SRGRVIGLVALALAASATHARGVILLPAAAIVLLLAMTRGTGRARGAVLVGAGGLAASAGVVLIGLSGLTQTSVTGGTRAHGVSDTFDLRQLASYVWQFYLPRLPFMDPSIGGTYAVQDAWVRTFIGSFGSLEIEFPRWIYRV